MDVEEIRAKARAKKNLRSPIRPREFILTFGVGGTGKSKSILDVARVCPRDTFWLLDSELQNYDRLMSTEYKDLRNVDVTPALEWTDWAQGIAKISDQMKVDDWVGIDSCTPSWDAVQGWFIERVHGEQMDDWFLQKRIQNQRVNDNAKKSDEKVKGYAALSGSDGDWQVINKTYFRYIYNALLRCPGHRYITAEQDSISTLDDREVRGMYGPYGVKPKGQKRLGYVPMTCLWLTKRRVGEWYMTTVKDRGRVELEDAPVSDFAEDYLVQVAGWGAATD